MNKQWQIYSLTALHYTLVIFYIIFCRMTNAFEDRITSSLLNKRSSSHDRKSSYLTINRKAFKMNLRRHIRDNQQGITRQDRFRSETRGIEARIGQGFQYRIPLSMFQVREEDQSGEWRLALRTAENHPLFSNSWIYVDSENRELIGFPMQGNEGLFEFLVRADGPHGQSMKRPLAIRVVTDVDRASHRVKMILGKGFLEFMAQSRVRIQFARFMSQYLQKRGITTGMRDIWVYKTDSVSKSLSWILTTFNRNVCNHVVTELLPSRLLSRGRPHPELVQKFKPLFNFVNISVEISEFCPKPVKNTKPKSPTTGQIVFGPLVVVVIIIVLGSPLVIAHVIRKNIRKRDRRRQFSQSRHMQLNGAAAPIWVDHEDEDKTKTKELTSAMKPNRYRWNPDLTGRPVLIVPNTPPARRSTSRQTSVTEEERLLTPVPDPLLGTRAPRVQNSMLTWHGLPSGQCVEADVIQLPSVVSDLTTSISRPLKDVFGYLSGKPEQNELVQHNQQVVYPSSTTASDIGKSDLQPYNLHIQSAPCSRKSSTELSKRNVLARQDTTKSEYANGHIMRDRSRNVIKTELNTPSFKWTPLQGAQIIRQESRETTMSDKSEMSLLGSAINKVSSLISLNNRQTPKVIRIFLSDESDDNTRNNSFDRSYVVNESQTSLLASSQRSSFERPSLSMMGSLRSSLDKPPSLVSSQRSSLDKPSPSSVSYHLSSFERFSPSLSSTQVNSYDILSQSRSFSQDGSYEDQSSISDYTTSFDRESINDSCQPHHRLADDAIPQALENNFRQRHEKVVNLSPEHISSHRRKSVDRLRSDGSSEGSFDNSKMCLIRQDSVRLGNNSERKLSLQDNNLSGNKISRDISMHSDNQLYSVRKNSLHPNDSRTIERRLKKQTSIYTSTQKQEPNFSPTHRIDTTNVHIQVPRYGQQTLSYPGVNEENSAIPSHTEIVYESPLNFVDSVHPSRV